MHFALASASRESAFSVKAASSATNISSSVQDTCGGAFRWDCIFCWCGCGDTSTCPSKSGCRATGTVCSNNACWCNYEPAPPPPPVACTSFRVSGKWAPIGYSNVPEKYSVEYGRTYTSDRQVGTQWSASVTSSMTAGFNIKVLSASKTVTGQVAAGFSAQYSDEISMTTIEKRVYDLSAGQAWQWQFEIDDTCGKSIIKGPSVVVTNSRPENPCCLPGYALHPANVSDPICRGLAGNIYTFCNMPPPPPPSNWAKQPSKNCYWGNGATELWDDRSIPGLSIQGCQQYCTSWYGWYGKTCTAIVTDQTGYCWLRFSVTIGACESDTYYDTYVVDSGGVWTKHASTNCYTGMGGVVMQDVPIVQTDLEDCKAICKTWTNCNAVTVDKGTDCWLRTDVVLAKCEDDTWFDTYLLDPATSKALK